MYLNRGLFAAVTMRAPPRGLYRWVSRLLTLCLAYVSVTLVLLMRHMVLTPDDASSPVYYCQEKRSPNGDLDYHITQGETHRALWDVFTLRLFLGSESTTRKSDVSPELMTKLLKLQRFLKYEEFQISEPFFLTRHERNTFKIDEDNLDFLALPNPERLVGLIQGIPGGVAAGDMDCGWGSDLVNFQSKPGDRRQPPQEQAVVPLFVPEGETFQHFLDGVLPKIIQAYDVIKLPGVKVAMNLPRDPIVHEMLARMNITCDKLVFTNYITSRVQINTCIAPPLHPTLWNRARRMLGAPERLPVPMRRARVVLLTRAGAYNEGRNIINFMEVRDFLEHRYGRNLHVFNGPYNLETTLRVFGRARLLIGVHGGAFYNLNFAPREAHVVEVLPVAQDGSPPVGLAHAIFWVMSQLLGQTYWRLNESPDNDFGDVFIPLDRLERVLNRVDRIHGDRVDRIHSV